MSASAFGEDGQYRPQSYSFFFYGTLCHPAILGRVLNRSCGDLQYQDAILPGYTRHHVRNEDYPALIDRQQYKTLQAATTSGSTGRTAHRADLTGETEAGWKVLDGPARADAGGPSEGEASCRGTLVHGLTYNDVAALDIFEGTEYSRKQISVLPLSSRCEQNSASNAGAARHLENHQQAVSMAEIRHKAEEVHEQDRGQIGRGTSIPASADTAEPEIKAWVYLWSDPVEKLEPEEWDFAAFLRDKAHLWTGFTTTEYADVERHHALTAQPGLEVDVDAQSPIADTVQESKQNGGHKDLKEGSGSDIGDVDAQRDVEGDVIGGVRAVDQDSADPASQLKMARQAEGGIDRPEVLRTVQTVQNSAGLPRSDIEGTVMEGFPAFGHNMRQYWSFGENTINLNNGSYGAPPLPILHGRSSYASECERDPNKYMKRTYLPLLTKARQAAADLIGAPDNVDEVVLVPNASSGVQLVLRELDWEEGDVILVYNSTYGAIAQSVKYITDRHPHVSMQSINLELPITHQSILDATAAVLRELDKPSVPNFSGRPRATEVNVEKRARCLVLDHVASVPGIVFPIAPLVKLCKYYGVLSLVDAAHAIGQVEVDVRAIDPDFWISNCHKWLFTPRGCAILYVPLRNQQLIRSSFPTGPGYESRRYPTQGMDRPWVFAQQYDWTGTVDWSPYLTIPDCIALRKEWGGEERIREYCRDLANKGGRRVAERWGTMLMGGEGDELTAAMVNVEMPSVPPPADLAEQYQQLTYFEDSMLGKDVFCMTYRFADRWWARFSAQIWCELKDFDSVASVLEEAIEGIKQGKHRKKNVAAEDESREQENALPK